MAGFFNTSWNIGNAFNSPFSMDQGELTNQESFLPMEKDARGLVERPGGYGPTGTPTWGAPTGYDPSQQQSNIFNPYSAGGNNYYNPYSFGQMTSGTQYGGGQEMPWWMNYNTNNAVPNIPTTPVNTMDQGKYVGNPNHSGTGPNGKDLTYDETIKYFGLYDNAESALAAGDSQAAYRKDHMQWRSGTGYYEGQGEGQGDYPGRPDLGIDGDAKRLSNLSGMFGGFNPLSLFNTEQNERGGIDYTVANEGTFVTPSGTTVETQFTRPSNVPNIFNPATYLNTTQDNLPRGFFPEAPNDKQLAEIQRSLLNQVYTVTDNGGSFIESDITPYNSYQNNQGRDRFGPAPTTQYDAGPAEMTIAEVNALAGVNGQARYEAGLAETAAAAKAAQEQAALQEQANIFLQNSLAEQKAREAEAKAAADKAAQDRQDAARRQNNRYETGPVTPNRYTTKNVNNSFAARRDIRNIFA